MHGRPTRKTEGPNLKDRDTQIENRGTHLEKNRGTQLEKQRHPTLKKKHPKLKTEAPNLYNRSTPNEKKTNTTPNI